MTITKEWLEAQRQQMQARREGLIANLNATAGALELIEALLARVQQPEPPAKGE